MSNRESLVVLLVEDNRDHAELIKRSMVRVSEQLRIVHLEDGEAALDYVHRRGRFADAVSYPRPALILLDLRLPRIDGLHLLKTIKQDAALRRVPVVVLSSSEAERDIDSASEAHANSYLVKPVGHERFDAMVQALTDYWLDWHRARGATP